MRKREGEDVVLGAFLARSWRVLGARLTAVIMASSQLTVAVPLPVDSSALTEISTRSGMAPLVIEPAHLPSERVEGVERGRRVMNRARRVVHRGERKGGGEAGCWGVAGL